MGGADSRTSRYWAGDELGLVTHAASGHAAAEESCHTVVVLGLPCLALPGGKRHVLEPRDAALLALVLLDGPLPRAVLARWLWPAAELSGALNNLRQRLHRLKLQAGCTVLTGHERLALAAGWQHDLQPRPCQWRAGDGVPDLLGAIELGDRGELAERVLLARQRWRQRWREAHVQVAEQCEREGRLFEALTLAEGILAADPCSEHAHRRLMRLHWRRGDRAAALAAFKRCRLTLRRHVDVEPGDETLALAQLIESGRRLP